MLRKLVCGLGRPEGKSSRYYLRPIMFIEIDYFLLVTLTLRAG